MKPVFKANSTILAMATLCALSACVSSGTHEAVVLDRDAAVAQRDSILFASGSAMPSVSDGSRDDMIKLADYLKGTDFFISVVGHTDSQRPTARLAERYPTNWELGSARAAVAARFLEQQGVDPARISAVSRSHYVPVATNDTADGRARNRRIQIILRQLP